MKRKNTYALNKSRGSVTSAFDFELKFKREKRKITILHVALFLVFTLFVLFGF